ncbi:hypothetical protein ACKWTF_010793 [Chironomus riparius]
MDKKFDVIIFGASGYTGKYVIREAVKLLSGYKWAVSGRNEKKLIEAIKAAEIYCCESLSDIPIIIADINDEKSLKNMTMQTKVVVNCCGPYRFFGEQVVKACIETFTHHVDVSGEPQYMESMQLKYHLKALENGVYIVTGCGFDSVPADLGTVYLQDNFKGTVNSIKIYIQARYLNDYEAFGPLVNYATYESAIHGMSHADQLRDVRKELFKTRLPKLKPIIKNISGLHKADDLNSKWCLSIPSADQSVINRSQRFFYENYKQRPIQIRTFTTFASLSTALKTVSAGILLNKMIKYKRGKELLLNYPELFSFGFTSRKGPSEEQNANTVFELILIGEGWNETFKNPVTDIDIPVNKKMTELLQRLFCYQLFLF